MRVGKLVILLAVIVAVTATIATQIIKRGFYLNVHELSSEDGVGAGITCGNIVASVYR